MDFKDRLEQLTAPVVSWARMAFREPDLADLEGDNEAILKVKKLKEEIAEIRRPWGRSTFSWSTILGLATLYAVWSSGVLNAKGDRLAAQKELIAVLDHKLKAKQSELSKLEQGLLVVREQSEAVKLLAGSGFQIQVAKSDYSNLKGILYHLSYSPHSMYRYGPEGIEKMKVAPKQPVKFVPLLPEEKPPVSQELIVAAGRLPNVYSLQLGPFEPEENIAVLVRALPDLYELSLSYVGKNDDGLLAAVAGLDNLGSLTIEKTDASAKQLSALTKLEWLAELTLGGTTVDAAKAGVFAKIPNLFSIALVDADLTQEARRILVAKGIELYDAEDLDGASLTEGVEETDADEGREE